MRHRTALAATVILLCSCTGGGTRPVATNPPPPTDMLMPLTGAALPKQVELLPGSPRWYRGGTHEGIDIYYRNGEELIPCNTPVLNTAEGWVVRADHEWKNVSEKEYNTNLAILKKGRDEYLLDRLRGRQVWVRLDSGYVLRYCHLISVATDIRTGLKIGQGVTVGTTGNTGTIDGALFNGRNCHLHFEVRTPDGEYLGKGLSTSAMLKVYSSLFKGPAQTPEH